MRLKYLGLKTDSSEWLITAVIDMKAGTNTFNRDLNVRPHTLDFRDKLYTANLYEVPAFVDLANYKKRAVPILDQGTEGTCTGFGLATGSGVCRSSLGKGSR